jgi:multicomponent Na+:H+ antiporter subunit D
MMLVTVTFMGGPFAAILINNLLPRALANKLCLKLNAAVSLLQMSAAFICLWLLFSGGHAYIDFSTFWDMNALPGAAHFTVDAFSLLTLFCIGLVSLISLLTAWQTVDGLELNFGNLLMTLVLGLNGLVIANDFFTVYIFLEVAGVSSFVLIALFRDKHGLEGAFKYLVLSAIASVLLLASLAFIFMETGSLRYAEVTLALSEWKDSAHPALLFISFAFFITSFGIKAGLAPFHGWLPDAHQSAPSAVSVLLSGIVTKVAGAYVVIRAFYQIFSGLENIHIIILLLGLFSILFGALAAMGQRDFKRVIAYSSISQIGYIFMGLAACNMLGFLGVALHFLSHATFKSALFVNAAVLKKQFGTTDLELLPGGLHARMPLTAVSFIIAFLSSAGIPPLIGFWSKLLIVIAVWQAGFHIIAGAALLAGIITAAYFLRLHRRVFFGQPDASISEITEVKGSLALAELLLSAITLGCGLLFPVLLLLWQFRGLF